jgi:hypothetical protein
MHPGMEPVTSWVVRVTADETASGWRATAVDLPHVGVWGATRPVALDRLRALIASIEHVAPDVISLHEPSGSTTC